MQSLREWLIVKKALSLSLLKVSYTTHLCLQQADPTPKIKVEQYDEIAGDDLFPAGAVKASPYFNGTKEPIP